MDSDLAARTRRYYQLVDADDVDGVLDWFADDAVYHRPGYPPMRGRAALARFYGGERVIRSGSHALEEVLVHDSSVAARGRFRATLKNGSRVELGFADFLRYGGDGRVVERRTFFEVPAV